MIPGSVPALLTNIGREAIQQFFNRSLVVVHDQTKDHCTINLDEGGGSEALRESDERQEPLSKRVATPSLDSGPGQSGEIGWICGGPFQMRAAPRLDTPQARCADCPIRHRGVCSKTEFDELAALEQVKTYRTYGPGEAIAWAGEKMSLVGSVVEGVAMLSRTLAGGRRQMVGLLLPSDFLGRPGREEASFDVVAATSVTFCMFRRAEFENLVAAIPHVEQRLLEMTLDELDAAREWMLLLGRKSAREKIASLFVIMARRNAALNETEPRGGLRFPFYITRQAMADYLGLTIETVSRQISALRKEGLFEISDNRIVHVPDLVRLIDESGDDADGGVLI